MPAPTHTGQPTAPATTPRNPLTPAWKPDWPEAAEHHRQWWRHEGLVLACPAPLARPRVDLPEPPRPASLRDRWIDPAYRARRSEYDLSRTLFAGDTLPQANMNVGAGDLAAMLGSRWQFADHTVWFEPCIDDPDTHPPLRFDRDSEAFNALRAMILAHLRVADGRYFVGLPDLIENLDILAALRDPQTTMLDIMERPEWVLEKIREINQAFFEAYDAFYDLVRQPDGSSLFCAFSVWGPGRVAKVQCDASAMISPAMFRGFVVPALTEQCQWLDHAMYHLDGEQCLCHVDALLEIEALDAIEWTPVGCHRGEGGGDPKWYDLYRRILAAGKSVQAIAVQYDEVIPLLDAVGGRGMYICTTAPDEEAAHRLVERVKAYR